MRAASLTLRLCVFLSVSSVPLWFVSSSQAAAAEEPTYWKDIRPVFRKHCIICHSAKNQKEVDVSGGLALDSYEAAIKGTKQPVLVPGKSKESLLIQLLHSPDENKRMPKDANPLAKESADLIARWIDAGAKEGVRPDAAIATATPAEPRRARLLDVVLPTNATPPKGVLGPMNPGRLELVLKVGPLAPVTAVSFSADGKQLASGCYGRVTVWDLTEGKPVKVLTNVLGAVNDLKFSPDGKLLAVAGGQPSFKGDLRLYDATSWQLVATLGGHDDVVFCVAFTADGNRLASASFDKTVRLWDVAAHKQQLVIPHHSDFVYGVAFSPDGKQVISCSKDRSVKVSSAADGKSLLSFGGMNEDVLTVAISPDGKQLASSGLEPGIAWWDAGAAERAATSGNVASASPRIRVQAGHGIAVHELCFSKDGKLLASAGADGTVRLWNGASGAAIRSLAVGSVVYATAVSPDGKRLASGSFDGQVRLWDVEGGRQLASLLSLPGDRWLIWTPEGYADAPELLKNQASWRMSGQAVAGEAVWNVLHEREAIAKALRGEAVPAPKFGP